MLSREESSVMETMESNVDPDLAQNLEAGMTDNFSMLDDFVACRIICVNDAAVFFILDNVLYAQTSGQPATRLLLDLLGE